MSRISDKTDEHVGRNLSNIEIAEELLETMSVFFDLDFALSNYLPFRFCWQWNDGEHSYISGVVCAERRRLISKAQAGTEGSYT